MVVISGGWGRIRTWINKRIRIKDTGNTFVGEDSGKVTTGDDNNFMGYQAGYANTTGQRNNFMGYRAGYANTTGKYNNFMGYRAGYANIIGNYNNFIGYQAGFSSTGYSNNFMGYHAGYYNSSGHSNCYIGNQAGYTNTTGIYNTFIGYKAGYFETGSYKIFIDNIARADEADGRIKALVYGIAAAATADQRLSINARLLVREVATYANDGAAGTGGLVAGEIYKHADGSLHIKL